MDEVDEELAELADLDDISNRSSACDCPAHVHDREFPLEIAKVELLMKSNKHFWCWFDKKHNSNVMRWGVKLQKNKEDFSLQGHEAAFDHVEMLCPPDEYSNPPSLVETQAPSATMAPHSTPPSQAPHSPPSPPTGTPTLSTASTSRRAPRATPNYSYGCLMKKWSL